ncbi:MAG: hypothetical protein K2H93_06140 [Oscillospiraceae bacterium]|nr:hypothetical protein [Oscillospiraceae bacterium]
MKSIHEIISDIIFFICLIMSIVSIWNSEDIAVSKILFVLGVFAWLFYIDREYYFFTYETLSKRQYKKCYKLKNKIAIYKKMFASGWCNKIAIIFGIITGLCLLLFLISMMIKWQTAIFMKIALFTMAIQMIIGLRHPRHPVRKKH